MSSATNFAWHFKGTSSKIEQKSTLLPADASKDC